MQRREKEELLDLLWSAERHHRPGYMCLLSGTRQSLVKVLTGLNKSP